MHLAIDPGNDTGWALFADDGTLTSCGLGDPKRRIHGRSLERVVIEMPQIYSARLMRGNPNDIVKLAFGAGKYAGRYEDLGIPVLTFKPTQWKGQVPKKIHNARVWDALSDEEKETANKDMKSMAPSKRNNVIDAIGLGKWAASR